MTHFDMTGLFMLGLLGTGHCLGMCGPLVLAFPGRTGRFLPHIWYHTGRLSTYAVIGTLAGGVGMALSELAPLQPVLRLAAAGALGWLGLVQLGWLREPPWFGVLGPQRLPGFKRLHAADEAAPSGHLACGAAFGLLPCGLSYAAYAQALGTGSATAGAGAALAFGLGTVPGLLLLGTGFAAVVRRHRRAADCLAGILMLGMAVHMAVRLF